MAQAFTPGLKVSPRELIRKLRELPVAGEILCKLGDRVKSNQPVAMAYLPGDLHILRIPEKMGLEPFEVLEGLKVQQGQEILEGTLLCEHSGLFGLLKSRFQSPVAGQIEFITERTGHVGVRTISQPIEIDAYISGTVVAIESGKSVTIEASAALVQGIFGIGGERKGKLHILDINSSTHLTEDILPKDMAGLIVVGGTRPSLQILRLASNRGAVGMVVGSIDDTALAGYLGYDLGVAITGDEKVPMSLIVTEGFGDIPLSGRVHELLSGFHGREASMNGATQVRAGALRPEILLCLDEKEVRSSQAVPGSQATLTVGSSIRIIRVPYFGKRGTVVELPSEMQKIETGAYARVLRAKLENGQVVQVPRANVELVF